MRARCDDEARICEGFSGLSLSGGSCVVVGGWCVAPWSSVSSYNACLVKGTHISYTICAYMFR